MIRIAPQNIKANRFSSIEWANKKVVVVAVPGAFTPTCSVNHIPPYLEKLSEIKSKGVDVIAVIAFNDAWVMSAWGKANGIKDDSIVSVAISGSTMKCHQS
jgi:alkyl hydroperoxide reductase 1